MNPRVVGSATQSTAWITMSATFWYTILQAYAYQMPTYQASPTEISFIESWYQL